MECLRGQTFAGRRGTIPCPTQGCLHRRFSIDSNTFVAEETSKADCLLQLRLRTGDTPDPSRPHVVRGKVWIVRGKVWSDSAGNYVERDFELTDAQYELVREHSARFSLIDDPDGGARLIDFEV